MRGNFSNSRARRRGQALLLAVLIMIFAALVSAAFIGVVATNINQTARQTDKDRAVVAAKAGLDYVNEQLTYSAEGDKWRTIPLPSTDPNYNFYYSQLDLAQGWAGQFERYPDPRGSVLDGPQFLAKVERIPYNLIATDPDFSHAGSLKITVIGLSADDPSAWHRTVAYKGGYESSPLAQTMRTVSNWDFKAKSNVVALANTTGTTDDGSSTTNPQLAIKDAQGDFTKLALPFTITISDPRRSITARSAVVTGLTGTQPNFVFTLAEALSPTNKAISNERVELAANLGAPTSIDYARDGITPATPLNPTLAPRVSDGTVSLNTNQVDSVRVNGGLVWSGQLLAEKLRSFQSAFGGPGPIPTPTPVPPGSIQASSVIVMDKTATASTVSIKDTANTISDTLQASRDSQTTPGGGIFPTSETNDKYQLVNDGWDRLKGGPTTNASIRDVSNFTPPDITTGQGLERYRNMTKYSQPANGYNAASAGIYGYGLGIYIDNSQDKEKVYDSTLATPTRREMTQSELVAMWLSSDATAPVDYTRTGTPTPTTDTANYPNTSLEQQHIRGWVGPDEFRARGVSIEFNNTVTPPTVIITRDARNDGTLANLGQDPGDAKAWKDSATGAPVNGLYRRELPWPTNGVIFAEGNVRIKGTVTNAPCSLTIVSMNNIYIEGSLDAAPYKTLLLAKRNVIMNPTRVLGRPDEQTVASAGTGTGPVTLTVADSSAFKVGDFIQTSTITSTATSNAESVSSGGYVTTAPVSPYTSLVYQPVGAAPTIAAGTVVRIPLPVMQSSSVATTPARNIPYSAVVDANTPIQRQLDLPALTPAQLANIRLGFNHQANKVPVFNVATSHTPSATLPSGEFLFSNNGVFITPPATSTPFLNNNATVFAQTDKKFRIDYVSPSAGSDNFPGTVASNPLAPSTPSLQSDAIDPTRNLGAISTAMLASNHPDTTAGTDWNYVTSVNTGYDALPFFYLAGVGNRVDYGTSPIPAETRPNINTSTPTPTPVVIPLATSISLNLNGTQVPYKNDFWDLALSTPDYDQTQQFGFNPTYTDTTNPTTDVLTSDQYFYQTVADLNKTTTDSRQPIGLLSAATNLLSFRLSDNLPGLTSPANYPAYRMMGLKLENVGLGTSASTISSIDPAYTLTVNAYVYAQTGSWFVISGPLFDERLRGTDENSTNQVKTFLDLNGNGTPDVGEYTKGAANTTNLTTFEAGDFADLNRNGILDEAEKHAMARYSRYNYQINFIGAIAENQTALVNDAGSGTNMAHGAVQDWMEKWQTTAYAGAGAANTYERMHYTFDPSVALGYIYDDPSTTAVVDPDLGFHLPQTLQLSYES